VAYTFLQGEKQREKQIDKTAKLMKFFFVSLFIVNCGKAA